MIVASTFGLFKYGSITFTSEPYLKGEVGGITIVNRVTYSYRKWMNVSRRQWSDLNKWILLSKEDREKYLIKPT